VSGMYVYTLFLLCNSAESNSELSTVPVMRMSTMTEQGVQEVKIEACERLLGHRVTEKMRTKKVQLHQLINVPTAGPSSGNLRISHRFSINRPTNRGKEKAPSDGHCQCEKEMDDHLMACQQIFEIEPLIDTLW
jgi:hypothetical protein